MAPGPISSREVQGACLSAIGSISQCMEGVERCGGVEGVEDEGGWWRVVEGVEGCGGVGGGGWGGCVGGWVGRWGEEERGWRKVERWRDGEMADGGNEGV